MVRLHVGRLVSYIALAVTVTVLLLTLSQLSALRGAHSISPRHLMTADRHVPGTVTADQTGSPQQASKSRHSDPTLLIDDAAVTELRSRPGGRVLCWVPTTASQLQAKVKAINATWIQRCDGHIFFAEPQKGDGGTEGGPLPYRDVVSLDVPPGYYNLTTKVVTILLYLYRYHLDHYDWFLKGDDDVYVVMENLRFLLAQYDSRQPVYLGHLFKRFLPQGYMAGGAAYVISKQALRLVVEEGYSKNKCTTRGRFEDLEVGRCLHEAGVLSHNSRDRFGRDTFHPLRPTTHILGPIPKIQLPQDYFTMVSGKECCSQLTISFHKLTPSLMLLFEHLLYRTSVYGRVLDMQAIQGLIEPRALPPLEK